MTNDVTQLLLDWRKGDPAALDKLLPLVYDELRRLAEQYMRRERPDHTLQATALVHEAYLRLVGADVQFQDRVHFFAVAAQMMRRILVDHARSYQYAKRGGGARKVSLDEAIDLSEERAADLVALDDALTGLAAIDPRKSQIVELRFFGGLTVEETAEVLGLSTATVINETRTARAWLYQAVTGEATTPDH
jgi:RNA polymerase sigma factor (TIGR02999 family)